MKRLLQFIMLFFAIALVQACKGPEGDPGPQGEQGEQGVPGATGAQGPAGASGEAAVYEFGDWNFTAENEYADGLAFADNDMEVTEGSVILAYRLANVVQDKAVWSPMPQTIMFPEGLLKYDFVHTDEILQFYLDAQFDLSLLGTGWTTGQAFRIVIVPGTIRNGRVARPDIDYKNYDEVAKYYNITEKDIKRIKLK